MTGLARAALGFAETVAAEAPRRAELAGSRESEAWVWPGRTIIDEVVHPEPAGPSAAPTIIDEVAPCCAGARCSFALDGDAARDGDEARLCWLAAAAAAMVVVRVLRRAS